MGLGDRTVLVVRRHDGSIVLMDLLTRDHRVAPDSSREGRAPMTPGIVPVHRRPSRQWRPAKRPPGFRRLHRRRPPDPRVGRMLAVPVIAILLVSASATALPPGETRAAGPVLGVAIDPVVRVQSTPAPSSTGTTVLLPSAVPSTAPADPTVPATLPGPAQAASPEECRERARSLPLRADGVHDRNLLARMIHATFRCVLEAGGLGEEAPTENRRWNGREAWGFASLAEQVAAEAVVVAYCESAGFRTRALERNNPWGYGGLFQMGTSEMRRFGPDGGDKFDPVDNTVAAAGYLLWGVERRHGWGGWGPWAVVNTDYDDPVNDRVHVPVLPRFGSTDDAHRGRSGPELPAWAVDPWTWVVPEWGGCPAMFGWRWPAAEPLGPMPGAGGG